MSRRRKPKEVLDFEREYLFPNGFRETRVNGRDGTYWIAFALFKPCNSQEN